MKIEPTGRKEIEDQLTKIDIYGDQWDREYLKSKLDYYCSTFLIKYLIKE